MNVNTNFDSVYIVHFLEGLKSNLERCRQSHLRPVIRMRDIFVENQIASVTEFHIVRPMSRIDSIQNGVRRDEQRGSDDVKQFRYLHDVEANAGDDSGVVFIRVSFHPTADRTEDFLLW